MSIRNRIERLEQAIGAGDDGGLADATLAWAPHEDPPEFLPADASPATVELMNQILAMDATVPRCD